MDLVNLAEYERGFFGVKQHFPSAKILDRYFAQTGTVPYQYVSESKCNNRRQQEYWIFYDIFQQNRIPTQIALIVKDVTRRSILKSQLTSILIKVSRMYNCARDRRYLNIISNPKAMQVEKIISSFRKHRNVIF